MTTTDAPSPADLLRNAAGHYLSEAITDLAEAGRRILAVRDEHQHHDHLRGEQWPLTPEQDQRLLALAAAAEQVGADAGAILRELVG